MFDQYAAAFVYLALFAPIMIWYLKRRGRREKTSQAVLASATEAGLTEPASLHPVVDTSRCIGCGACIAACPEQPDHHVLGLIDGHAALVSPTDCIGHGACKSACPVDAITLVFGTEKRGVDLPVVAPDFQSDVPGIFIAGELGGMGLIRNAIAQGSQAVDAVRRLDGMGGGQSLDLLIVGAGPAGISASLAAMQHRLRSVTVEQDSLGGTVAQYPRGKVVMTQPVDLPIVGKVKLRETSKEALIELWRRIERESGLEVSYGERVEKIERAQEGPGFVVRTTQGVHRCRAVLLAIGRRGTPRRLGVPGESLKKVTYRLIDPEQYLGQQVLVVGGGDSALEAAASLAVQPGTQVTLSYRSGAFTRAKKKNRQRVDALGTAGQLDLRLASAVTAIEPGRVMIEQDGVITAVPNTAVIICAGGILPTAFLRETGIGIETHHGTARDRVAATA